MDTCSVKTVSRATLQGLANPWFCSTRKLAVLVVVGPVRIPIRDCVALIHHFVDFNLSLPVILTSHAIVHVCDM